MKRVVKLSLTTALALLLAAPAWAGGHALPEKHYQKVWCDAMQGVMEVRMPDGSRCDCETASHMVEFDFSHGEKPFEAIGQALNYARFRPDKRAGIVLILDSDKGQERVTQLREIAKYYRLPLDVWFMEVKP